MGIGDFAYLDKTDYPHMRYGDWLHRWMHEQQRLAREATYATYSMAVVNHIIPLLGHLYVEDITEQIVQETALYWLERGRCDGCGGLLRKSVRDLLAIVKTSLKAARKHCGLPAMIMDIRLPQPQLSQKPKVFTLSELRILVGAASSKSSTKNMGILLALYSGLRIGELCALRWEDVDFERTTLAVTKTIQKIYTKSLTGETQAKTIISSPKTKSSVRELPLSSEIVPMLMRFRAPDDHYLITGKDSCMGPRSYRSYYSRFLQRSGITASSFHKLRHTFATQLIESGADVKTVSQLLGHASVKTTLDLYVHPQLEQKRKCIAMMPSFR
jgi:integrase